MKFNKKKKKRPESTEWIQLTQNKVQCQSLIKVTVKLPVKKGG